MKFDLRELALFAEQTVFKAGDRISDLRNREKIEVNYKDAGKLVTSADLLSERIIQEAIKGTLFNGEVYPILSLNRVHFIEERLSSCVIY